MSTSPAIILGSASSSTRGSADFMVFPFLVGPCLVSITLEPRPRCILGSSSGALTDLPRRIASAQVTAAFPRSCPAEKNLLRVGDLHGERGHVTLSVDRRRVPPSRAARVAVARRPCPS